MSRIQAHQIVLALIVSIAAGCGASSSNTSQTQSTRSSYEFNDKDKAALHVLVFDDLLSLANGADASDVARLIFPDAVVVTSNQLQNEYEKNEVAGDLKFRKKTLFLSGKVASIDRSIGENYFLKLRGGSNMFIQPQASMAEGYTQFLASLSKGDTVYLACIGGGMTMGSAMASSCEPLYNYLDKVTSQYVKSFKWATIASGDNEALKNLGLASVVIAPYVDPNGACQFNKYDEKKCGAELQKIFKKENIASEASSARAKLGLPPKETEKKATP